MSKKRKITRVGYTHPNWRLHYYEDLFVIHRPGMKALCYPIVTNKRRRKNDVRVEIRIREI